MNSLRGINVRKGLLYAGFIMLGIMMFSNAICMASETTIVVAASDSSDEWKKKAAYLCDGIDDQNEILAAFNKLPYNGGTVILSDGTFKISDAIVVPQGNTCLQGQGEDITILDFVTSTSLSMKYTNMVFKDFQVTGQGRIMITNDHNKLYNIKAYRLDNMYMAAYMIYAYNKYIDDVQLYNCKAVDCNRWGFVHSGEGAANQFGVKNIIYENCQAVNCGKYDQYYGQKKQHTKAWDVGFDIMEMPGGVAENVTYINCLAEGCWETGFYVEAKTTFCRNVRFLNCISRNNGQDKQRKKQGGAEFGAGWIVATGMHLENCISENNINGYHCSDRGGILEDCKDIGSSTGFLILLVSTSITLNNCQVNESPRPVYIWTGNTYNVVINNMKITSASQRNNTAITIENLARNPADIMIKNSYITGYDIGIDNRAYTKGLVKVNNVEVVNAKNEYVHCEIVAMPSK